MGWSLGPSRWEKNDQLEQNIDIYHKSLCMLSYLVPFVARNNLGKLIFSPTTSPQNGFHRCLHGYPSTHITLIQVRDTLGKALKKISYTRFHGECKTSQISIGSAWAWSLFGGNVPFWRYAIMSSIHVRQVFAWNTSLATSILEFAKNSRCILLSEIESKVEARLARASAFLFSSLWI